jgi:glycosyltransferase involved in cell wall biosynthesis
MQRSMWVAGSYSEILRALRAAQPDVIFVFHMFHTFPTEIRRMLLDLGLDIPIVGYTHGSHWDFTDTFRSRYYHGLEFLDLANLAASDRVLVVSRWMQTTLSTNIGAMSEAVAEQVLDKVRVVGLPIDLDAIDAARPTFPKRRKTTIVFNHSCVSSKRPEVFIAVVNDFLPHYDAQVVFTRRFARPEAKAALERLATRFPGRVWRGEDLPTASYYKTLWQATIQVSTATHESLGIATLEAMFTENCCIVPRCGSYPEIMHADEDVLYDGSEAGLSAKLAFYLDQPEMRDCVSGRLRHFAAEHGPEVVVERIADVLRGV